MNNMVMDEGEIIRDYKAAKRPFEQVKILAELNGCTTKAMATFLQDRGCIVDKRYLMEMAPYRKAIKAQQESEEQEAPAAQTVTVPRMKVYISGPITNNPGFQEKFKCVQEWLRGLGFDAVNPALNGCGDYRREINTGLQQLMECSMLCPLPEWGIPSEGATLERVYADTIGMPVINIPAKLWQAWEKGGFK